MLLASVHIHYSNGCILHNINMIIVYLISSYYYIATLFLILGL